MTTQTKSTHTPGPWKMSSCSDGREIVSHSCGMTFPIAEACDGLGKANGLKEAQANARLIASAPDLLDSLRDILEMVTDNRLHGEEVYRAANAIRKAEGRI